MIESITAVNYMGDAYTMYLREPEKSGFIIRSITGLGPAKATINTSALASADGSLFNSSRLGERNIVIKMSFMSDTDDIESVRQKSYSVFPVKKKVTIYVKTNNRYVAIDGYTESNEPDIFSKDVQSSISVICPNPYFYEVGPNSPQRTIFTGVEAEFEFFFEKARDYKNLGPDGFPLKGGVITLDDIVKLSTISTTREKSIYYDGDETNGITMTIHANEEVAGDITIRNLETHEFMKIYADKLEKLTGSHLKAFDELVICTVIGSKGATLVRDGIMYNVLNCIDRDSDWFQLGIGDNLFGYFVEGEDITEKHSKINLEIVNTVIFEGV